MTERLSDERLRYLSDYPEDVECEDVRPMADELIALRAAGPIDVSAWNIAQGQIAELQHRLSAGPVMPETPSDEVIHEIMEAVVYDAVRRSMCLKPLYDSVDTGVCLMKQALAKE